MTLKRKKTHAELSMHSKSSQHQQHNQTAQSNNYHHHYNHRNRHLSSRVQQQQPQMAQPNHTQQSPSQQLLREHQIERPDEDFIPLPIQTFLWRQTSPFIRPFLGKARDLAQIEQRDACKLFERIIITNNIWGQSPSLTDAIASIGRWRLIKVSFPFVLQCTAALLSNKLIKDRNFNRLGGNEAKMMYTLQWILMNAARECADSENEAQTKATHVTMAAASVASLVKPDSQDPATFSGGPSHTSTGGLLVTQATISSVASTSSVSATTTAPSQQHQVQDPTTGCNQRVGSTSNCGASQSILPPTATVAVGQSVAPAAMSQQSQPHQSSSISVAQIGPTSTLAADQSDTVSSSPQQQQQQICLQQIFSNAYLLSISSIQMFVYYFAPILDGLEQSDFLTSNQRLESGAALWEPLFNHQLPDIHCLKALIRQSSVSTNKLIEQTSVDLASKCTTPNNTAQRNQSRTGQSLVGYDHFATSEGATADRRSSSSFFKSSAQFGDVFLGSPAPTTTSPLQASQSVFPAKPDTKFSGHLEVSSVITKSLHATYLDVAVLRCLSISDWQESGVFWAINYLANRFNEDLYINNGDLELLLSKKRHSKSLSCICGDDLKQNHFKKSLVTKIGESGAERTRHEKYIKISQDESGNNMDQRHGQHDSMLEEGCLLRVVGDEDSNQTDSGATREAHKSLLRCLSSSPNVQTLANQIRMTSKQEQQSSLTELTSHQPILHQSKPISDSVAPSTARSLRVRRFSSAEDLSSDQVSALSLLHGQLHQTRTNSSDNLIITVLEPDNREANGDTSSKKTEASGKVSTQVPSNERQHLIQSLYSRSLQRFEQLTRSQSVPKNIQFAALHANSSPDQLDVCAGADFYIDSEGRIDPLVLLKILHLISQRESACSLRVCSKILLLIKRLIKLNILSCKNLSHNSRASFDKLRSGSHVNMLPTKRQFNQNLFLSNGQLANLPRIRNQSDSLDEEMLQNQRLVHTIMIDIVFRLYYHLGCPNQCGKTCTLVQHESQQSQVRKKISPFSDKCSLSSNESNMMASRKIIRISLRECLELLHSFNKNNFILYVQDVFKRRNLHQVVDILHSTLGFCRLDYLAYLKHRNTNLPAVTTVTTATTLDQQAKQKGTGALEQSSEIVQSLEAIIVSHSFRQLITRITKLRMQENTSLYCDIRRLINFIRENYASTFRSVVLSALIDCTKLINQQQAYRTITNNAPANYEVVQQNSDAPFNLDRSRGSQSKRALYGNRLNLEGTTKPGSAATGLIGDSSGGNSTYQNQRYTSVGSRAHLQARAVHATRIQDQRQQRNSRILSLSKAKKKLEQVFGGKQDETDANESGSSQTGAQLELLNHDSRPALTHIGHIDQEDSICCDLNSTLGQHKNNSIDINSVAQQSDLANSTNENSANDKRHYYSSIMSYQLIKQNQLIYSTVQVGMSNFSYLMESCLPGHFLDPALLAALLDLKSPIGIRAAILLECANFVHRCNRGQWPSWMHMNVVNEQRTSNADFTSPRASTGNAVGPNSLLKSKLRKSSSIQRNARDNTMMYRAAGCAFYAWAEAIGTRLEELSREDEMNEHKRKLGQTTTSPKDDSSGMDSATIYDPIDFLQPTSNNDPSPLVLKMAACQLLFEVTAFLRETYRYLPTTIVQHQAIGSKSDDKMSSIYDVSRAVTANRRWSMALSSLGFVQLPATLSALSANNCGGSQLSSRCGNGAHNNLSTSAANVKQPERQISFILHETKDEDDQHPASDNGNNECRLSRRESMQQESSDISADSYDPLRKLTDDGGCHLSQSSASSAVVVAAATLLRSSGAIESQPHRRKSIKLRKSIRESDKQRKQAKFAQDLDVELENSSLSGCNAPGSVCRRGSLRSSKHVSEISERGDNGDLQRADASIPPAPLDSSPQLLDMSGNESAENKSSDSVTGPGASTSKTLGADTRYSSSGYPTAKDLNEFEADDSKMMSNFSWFKAISLVNASIDCNCSHFPSCTPTCHKLHQETCKRLITFVQTIYQDPTEQDTYFTSLLESQLAAGLFRPRKNASSPMDKTQDSRNQEFVRNSKGVFSADIAPSVGQITPSSRYQLGANIGTMDFSQAARKRERGPEKPAMIKYLRSNVKSLLFCPMSSFLKGAIILPRDNFLEMIRFSWKLLLEDDQHLSRTAAVCFIVSAIKCPVEAAKLLADELESDDASRKMAAINKFYVIWDARYQCWPRLENGAFVHFKMAPPSVEFTLPSPKIAQESSAVVDPAWMPHKTSNIEEVTIGQDQTVQKSFVTATKTRRKQQIELVTKALREKCDKLRKDRENYHITSAPITRFAAFEPTLASNPASVEDELGAVAGTADVKLVGDLDSGATGSCGACAGSGNGATTDEQTQQENRALFQIKTAQALFPTCLCQSAIVMINLLDDPRVTYEGSAVYEIASRVIWSCLVEDPELFLRYFFEQLTRQNQSTIFQVLRRLIRFMPQLPPQAAFTLYNYLIGLIIYYIRCPFENSQKFIADTLSVLCLVVPSVHGLFLKDLKQILRKEQCERNLLITANVPSAKKIIIHGSDSSGIPSQFPIDETTQFYHILVDSLEFFGIEKDKQNEHFLIDVRTNLLHNLHSYVRDHYSFRRSQYPQLQLINMDPSKAFDILQRQELINQFMEFNKVLMSLSIIKSPHMAVQRALVLHEELMKLPTFPRKPLETNFSLFRGPLGHQVFSMDRIHKISWVRLIARMFELTSGFFLQLGDIQLFLNAISGIFVLHCEEASVSRLCLATFINATHQFKSIFATDGFLSIMATIVQVYSNHQNNQLLCRSIEFVCKQFYIIHRKPFLLQLFGSVASRLNIGELLQLNQVSSASGFSQQQVAQLFSNSSVLSDKSGCGGSNLNGSTSGAGGCYSHVNDPNRVSPSAFFKLLLSLDKAFKDPLDILELVDAEKPLRAVDFCYQQDKEAIEILDIISLCVTVTAYASESPRSTQMLIILDSVVPLYMKNLQANTSKKAGPSMGKQAHKDELQKIQNISICIRTLIVNCEGLTRNFSGSLPSIEFQGSSIRRADPVSANGGGKQSSVQQRVHFGQRNNSADLPMDIHKDGRSVAGLESRTSAKSKIGSDTQASSDSKQTTFAKTNKTTSFNTNETEIARGEFIVPRETLLNLVAEFLAISTSRLVESAKKYVELHQKHSSYELLDVKSHLRLAEVANSLLKFASIDPSVMACRGLIRYMNEILPNTEWRHEAIRPALVMILKRLDKTFNRIAKKDWIKRITDWDAAKQLLKGAYLTFIKHPYIVHLPHLKSLINCCQNIMLSDAIKSLQFGSNLLHSYAAADVAASNSTNQQQLLSQSEGRNRIGVANQSLSNSQQSRATNAGSPSASGHHLTPLAANILATATGTGAKVVPTGAVAAAHRLALAANSNSQSLTSSHSTTSQGFESVTIRLIAMQLLQTGDSQTLENFFGNSMNTPEKLEALMLNIIYPMCIRVCSGAREAPKLRLCDIKFILNIVLNMLAPQSASSRACSTASNAPKSNSDNASHFILSKITTTIGSTQTGATALNIVGDSSSNLALAGHQSVQDQEWLKLCFLGLKILCVCFESQLASEWIRITRVIRDLAQMPGQPSEPMWDFLDFVATYRFPIFILLLPTIECNIGKRIREQGDTMRTYEDAVALNYYEQCYKMIESKIHGSAPTVCRNRSFLFVSLTVELRMLKEQLIAKQNQLIERDRSAVAM